MCRAGGPRCTGKGRQASGGVRVAGKSVATREGLIQAVAEVRTLEDRDRVDQLAAEMPAGRKDAFGNVLDERGRRMFALRESGYTGPINQDGYPDTTSEGAGILRRMAEQRGETVTW